MIIDIMVKNLLFVILFSLISDSIFTQTRNDRVYVDKQGIMRWNSGNKEVYGFGVNYTLPFAHEYRMASKTGKPLEEFIRQDVYHMARLGLDFYRLHVWDTEISDTAGNLLENEHLNLFDFAINEMKQRGIKFIITPIAFWGNGWPEDDQKTPGFSYKYGKAACLTNPEAIEAQANYLGQFLNHVNPYTGMSYKEDPSVIGFEVSNEPHHNESPEKVTAYIRKMVLSIQKTGCKKPVFYNMSHSIHLADAYMKAGIQGGTFQWYPTGLVANHQINGNFLPNITDYTIPFATNPQFKKMAKIIYEFDPADAGGNYMYPAMAVAFRKAGMQLAAQFAYDAMCVAPYNTNYGTHYMNLAYSPQKAISLKIASAVFHHLSLEKIDKETIYQPLSISYPDNLAVWITDRQFFYSNNTLSNPSDPARMEEIAGCGSSPIIKYDGTGTYFLDKIDEGIWRLEVMPDAYWIDDPYGPASPFIQKAAVMHNERTMQIHIPGLGKDFVAKPMNAGNNHQISAQNGSLTIIPGVYLLTNREVQQNYSADYIVKNFRLGEYAAPESNLCKTVVHNFTADEVTENNTIDIRIEVISPAPVSEVNIIVSDGSRGKNLKAVQTTTGIYQCIVPSEMVTRGYLSYSVTMVNEEDTITFPGSIKGNPFSWVNRNRKYYQTNVLPVGSQLVLWDAESDWEYSYKVWDQEVRLVPGSDGSSVLSIKAKELPLISSINDKEQCYALRFYFGEKIKGRHEELRHLSFLVIKARNNLKVPQSFEAGLVDSNGAVLSSTVLLKNNESVYKIPLDSMLTGEYYLLPRPYPDFLPLKSAISGNIFDRTSAEALQFVIKTSEGQGTDLEIEKIWLE